MTVLSLLQDPVNEGGIGSVIQWYRAWMNLYRPGVRREFYLDDRTTGNFVSRMRRWTPSDEAVPRLLPRLHAPQYFGARRIMRPLRDEVDESHVIGGSVLHGALGASLPSVVWIGTTIRDERISVLPYHDRSRRILYRTTLPLLQRIESAVLHKATRILAQSSHTADLVVAGGIPVKRIEVVPVPVDTDIFKPDAGLERRGLLFVGRALDPRKGLPRAIRLLDGSTAAAEAGLDVISSGEPPPTLSQRIRDGQVRWWGRVDSVAERVRSAQIFLLPSYQEGFGIAAFEAVASGTPVVAMRSGGPDALLERCGAAMVAETEEAFARYVDLLLNDSSLRADMGSAGRCWAEEQLSASKFLADKALFHV